jgi:nucleoside-diphosphate-sugar epimerase
VGQSILLTGATGAIGPHLLQQLLQDEAFERVFVLMRPAAQRDPGVSLPRRIASRHRGNRSVLAASP